jgi:hypothetical protein
MAGGDCHDGILRFVRNRVKTCGLLAVVTFLLSIAPAALLATSGTFRGVVTDPPSGDSSAKVLYVKARNGMVRKVDISSAVVVYEASVPESSREKKPAQALKSGVDVRVTAEQGDSGDWKATRVEIVGDDEQTPVERQAPAPLDDRTSVT